MTGCQIPLWSTLGSGLCLARPCWLKCPSVWWHSADHSTHCGNTPSASTTAHSWHYIIAFHTPWTPSFCWSEKFSHTKKRRDLTWLHYHCNDMRLVDEHILERICRWAQRSLLTIRAIVFRTHYPRMHSNLVLKPFHQCSWFGLWKQIQLLHVQNRLTRTEP